MTSTTQNVGAGLAPALHPSLPQFTERPQTPHSLPKQYEAISSLFAPN
jgi:hypothetical protein